VVSTLCLLRRLLVQIYALWMCLSYLELDTWTVRSRIRLARLNCWLLAVRTVSPERGDEECV
jgi:hypothetical protein